ncbi:MAG: Cu2+-exporting ATPase [Phenylobacterium sp.]|jgi:Cu2+-exporting ATPase
MAENIALLHLLGHDEGATAEVPVEVLVEVLILCFHCQQPVLKGGSYQFEIEGRQQPMCCPGCMAAASMIQSADLSQYYTFRKLSEQAVVSTEQSSSAFNASDQQEYQAYAKADFLNQYSRVIDEGTSQQSLEVDLIISGIRCAACVWLLENYLTNRVGVKKVSIDLASHRAYLSLVDDDLELLVAAIFAAIKQLGYQAYPYVASIEENLYQHQKRNLLKALGVSAIGVMQVMMFTVALYAGAFEGMSAQLQSLLRWSSLFVATPVVLYAARLFFMNAWRDLKKRRAGMDLPVALAIAAAYIASLINTVWLTGEVYFESVAMFTFFLLLSRYIELTARQQRCLSTSALVSVFPTYALRYQQDQVCSVLLNELKLGDTVQVKNGAVIPADGVIATGCTQIDESAFSGESLPLSRKKGDQVFAGSINVQNPFDMTVASLPQQSLISNMVRLSQRAAADKPAVALLADKIAGQFVLVVLLIALVAAIGWSFVAVEQVFAITLAVLVVSCPCALSLATPVALSVASSRLMAAGLMPTTGVLLPALAEVDCVLFDKTGTLTDGQLTLAGIYSFVATNDSDILNLAAALENGINHPLAKAITDAVKLYPGKSAVKEQLVVQGGGVSGVVNRSRYYLGNADFVAEETALSVPQAPCDSQNAICVVLADEQQVIAWLVFRDQLKADAKQALNQIQNSGKSVHLVSGDSAGASEFIAGQLAIDHVNGQMSPEDKVAYLSRLTAANHKVLMVGDGINDAAALKQAHVSVAMSNATEFVQAKADGVMLCSQVQVIADALVLANKTQRIIGQNIGWALAYNLTAMPLAALGLIAPWLAALGMSLSSLLVLLNSYRLKAHHFE